jgi:hypothetical protein
MSIEQTIRKAFDPSTRFAKNPMVDMRFLSGTAQFIEVEVKHRTTGTYLCIVECDYKDDVLEARLLQAQNQSGEYATRSVYISLQSAIDKMHDVIFLEMVQGE